MVFNVVRKKREMLENIPVVDVNPKTWANVALDSVLELEKRGLYNPDLLYRTFSSDRMPSVKKYGTDRSSSSDLHEVFGESPEEVIWGDGEADKLVKGSWIDYGSDKVWNVSVYDKGNLTFIGSDSRPAYRLNGSFPVAILRIDLKTMNDDSERLHYAEGLYREFTKKHSFDAA